MIKIKKRLLIDMKKREKKIISPRNLKKLFLKEHLNKINNNNSNNKKNLNIEYEYEFDKENKDIRRFKFFEDK